MTDFRLSAEQREILNWIAAGCPRRDWPDYGYRLTARALSARGLVQVSGRGPAWTATITDAGKNVLLPEDKKPSTRPKRQSTSQRSAEPSEITGAAILEELTSSGGSLTIPNPSESIRASYRRALFDLQQESLPDGHRVRFTGRNRGDLVIKLVIAPRENTPLNKLPVPTAPDSQHPIVVALRRRLSEISLSETSYDRALCIHQALADEANSRGYTCIVPKDAPETKAAPTLRISIADIGVNFHIHEEKIKVHTAPPDQVHNARYDWQRIPMVKAERWSGRLVLAIGGTDRDRKWWADRKRWALEDRLAKALQAAEEYSARVIQERAEANAAKQQRLEAWNDAVPKARAAHIEALNRERATTQLADFQRARELRAFADAIDNTLLTSRTEQQPPKIAWAAWLREEADRTDPLLQPDRLIIHEPESLSFVEVDRFMPHGLTSRHPPD